jgi:acetyl esterase/lipase
VYRDVVFADRLGFRPLTLDLHLPTAGGTAPFPVVVFVHGGGWRTGSRRVFCPGVTPDRSFGLVTAAGFAVAAIDYRLSVEDVLSAIEWIDGDGSSEFGLDPARVVLWGESAGAHLAALAALSPDGGGGSIRRVAGVIDWYGPADLTTMGAQLDPEHPEAFADATDTREAGLLGGSPSALPEIAVAASPVFAVRPDAPPFLIAHGTADTLVPYAQSADFAAALEAAGVAVELVPVPGASHFWRGAPDTDTLFAAAVAFAHRVTGAGSS